MCIWHTLIQPRHSGNAFTLTKLNVKVAQGWSGSLGAALGAQVPSMRCTGARTLLQSQVLGLGTPTGHPAEEKEPISPTASCCSSHICPPKGRQELRSWE